MLKEYQNDFIVFTEMQSKNENHKTQIAD